MASAEELAGRVYPAGPPYAEEYRRRAAVLVRAAGLEPVDPMRRDFRGKTVGNEAEIVEGDLRDIDACDAILAAFTHPDEGTAMEAWYAHSMEKPLIAYTGGTPPHPWTVFVSTAVESDLVDAVEAIRAAQPDIPVHVYEGAGHGFNCDQRTSYNDRSAVAARQRTVDFLAKNVG